MQVTATARLRELVRKIDKKKKRNTGLRRRIY
jgi:hypothetical protein